MLGRLLAVRYANVNQQAIRFGDNLAFLAGLQVHGLCAHNAPGAFLADQHPAAQYHAGVNAADRGEPQHAVFLDAGDHQADLVHMRGEHELVFWRLRAFFECDDVAETVHPAVGVVLYFAQNGVPHGVLAAGYPGNRTQRPNCINHALPPPSVFAYSHRSWAVFSTSSRETTSTGVCI